MNIFPSAGFATTSVLVFLVFFGGDLWSGLSRSLSGTLFKAPVSSVDAKCKHLWLDVARNDPALKCYLTHDIGRFCKKAERDHLAWLIDRYVQEQANFDRTLMAYLVRVQLNLGKTAPGSKDPLEALSKAQKQAALQTATPDLKKAVMMDTLLNREMRALIQRPFNKGLLVRDDLHYRVTDQIEHAFELEDDQVRPKLSTCRQES